MLDLPLVKASLTFRPIIRVAIVSPGNGDVKGVNMAKYSKKSQSEVKKAMHERKKGTLKSGKSGKKVTSRKQAIAIGLSKARKKGAKVPRKKSS
jgi:hypothetical protein